MPRTCFYTLGAPDVLDICQLCELGSWFKALFSSPSLFDHPGIGESIVDFYFCLESKPFPSDLLLTHLQDLLGPLRP